jgi:hypothetical protein
VKLRGKCPILARKANVVSLSPALCVPASAANSLHVTDGSTPQATVAIGCEEWKPTLNLPGSGAERLIVVPPGGSSLLQARIS